MYFRFEHFQNKKIRFVSNLDLKLWLDIICINIGILSEVLY